MGRRQALLPVAALALLAVSGCDRSSAVTVRGEAMTITLDEYSVSPQRVVLSGRERRVAVTVRNVGVLNHNLKVRRKRDPRAGIETLRPGETAGFVLDLDELAPGGYTMYCSVNRHEDLGQHGTLIIKRGQG